MTAQSATLLRLRNAASADRLVVDSAGGMVVTGTWSQGAIPATGMGIRMMWYPAKGAFRAGYSGGAGWDDASVGGYSVAMGANTTASGYISSALGYLTSATGDYSTAFGNYTNATGIYSTALGYGTTASGSHSTAMGDQAVASGNYSTAIGDATTASGHRSTAIGSHARTNGQDGAFVYGDASTVTNLTATAANQFSVRAAGGYRFFTNSGMSLGAQLGANQTAWSTLSDRNRKTAFLAVDGEQVLSRIRRLPVSTWIYTDQPDASVRHIGPMAQDWHAAFGFSADSLTINAADFDGVNLAAVQALADRTERLRAENEALRRENAALRAGQKEVRARLLRVEKAVVRRPASAAR